MMSSQEKHKKIGTIVRGSLTGGLEMKLIPEYSVEDIRAGKFVVIEGEKNQFLAGCTVLFYWNICRFPAHGRRICPACRYCIGSRLRPC